MILRTSLILSWPIERLYDALNDPGMMQKVAFPLVIFKPQHPASFPERWQQSGTYRMSMSLFGIMPIGVQSLTIYTTKHNGEYLLRDYGPGFPVREWDHTVQLTAQGPSATVYEETLSLKAGILSPIVYVGMKVLFAWRAHRWKGLT